MKNKIYDILKKIEKEEKIKILFAVESGSRAWGMESINSDYDIRFVFYRNKNEYLKIDLPEEVITKNFDKDFKPSKTEGCFIDIMGFDLFKFLRMLLKSNPTCIEWINSDVIYLGKPNKIFYDFTINNFNPTAMFYHYKSMCNQNYKKYIDSGNEVTYKKYLYAMRGLVNAKYIIINNKLPNIKFPELLKQIRGKSVIEDKIIDELLNIIKLKKELREKEIVQNYKHMDEYIERFLKEDLRVYHERKIINKNLLNKEILRILTKNKTIKLSK